jgi:hypothetical protein
LLHVNVHAACPIVRVHVAVHAHAHDVCLCSMPMLILNSRAHAHAACLCPCPCCLSTGCSPLDLRSIGEHDFNKAPHNTAA